MCGHSRVVADVDTEYSQQQGERNGPARISKIMRAGPAPLLFLPGTQWKYSAGHDVVARLVEVWTGCSYEEFLRSEVCSNHLGAYLS